MMRTASAVAAAEEAVVNTQPLTTAEKRQLDTLTKGELIDLAEQRGVTVDASWTKKQCADALKVTTEAAKGFAGVPKTEESVPTVTHVIASLSALLDQRKKFPPPAATEWSCNAPADQVLRWLIEKGMPADLFQDGAGLAAFLRSPANAKQIKASGIHIAFPPWQNTLLIRVERCDPREYRRTDI